jgi:hypothetical protein
MGFFSCKTYNFWYTFNHPSCLKILWLANGNHYLSNIRLNHNIETVREPSFMKNSRTLLFLFYVLCFAGVAFAQVNKGIIAGQLMTKGGTPLAGGQVYFFNAASGPPPSQIKYWRVPDYVVQIDEGGRFSIELPAGEYYLGAIKRISRDTIGPPSDGDYFFASADEEGFPKSYTVKNGETIDLGLIAGAVPFQKRTAMPGSEITAIEGTVLNNKGKAVEGAMVLAQLTPLMQGRHPLFTSGRTGKDGHYILKVHDGGSYYLRVRSMHDKGPPAAGEMIGAYTYGGKEPVAVVVNKGQVIKGIDITVVPFAGQGAAKGQDPNQRRSGPSRDSN